jgi:hypothetical protein
LAILLPAGRLPAAVPDIPSTYVPPGVGQVAGFAFGPDGRLTILFENKLVLTAFVLRKIPHVTSHS